MPAPLNLWTQYLKKITKYLIKNPSQLFKNALIDFKKDKSKKILKLKGILALEIGNGQVKKVSKILFDNNFRIKQLIKDYGNNVRCVFAQLK